MKPTEMWLGISTDEIQRMKWSRMYNIEYFYPLIYHNISRNDCVKFFKDNNFPVPVKSSCVFCPFHSDKFWLDIKKENGDAWKDSVRADRAIRDSSARGVKDKLYLHRSLKPLEEVDLNEKVEGLVNKSEKSGISYSILKKVYDRGLAAYKTGHRPGTTAPQWAFARVNSFITGGGARKSDNDPWKQHKEEFNEWGELEEASEYQGKKVTLNKPFYTPDGPKKSAVYVTGPKGKVVIVRFGDPDMKIKVNDPERRKSFRARHNCDNPGPKWKARYWSCKAW